MLAAAPAPAAAVLIGGGGGSFPSMIAIRSRSSWIRPSMSCRCPFFLRRDTRANSALRLSLFALRSAAVSNDTSLLLLRMPPPPPPPFFFVLSASAGGEVSRLREEPPKGKGGAKSSNACCEVDLRFEPEELGRIEMPNASPPPDVGEEAAPAAGGVDDVPAPLLPREFMRRICGIRFGEDRPSDDDGGGGVPYTPFALLLRDKPGIKPASSGGVMPRPMLARCSEEAEETRARDESARPLLLCCRMLIGWKPETVSSGSGVDEPGR